MTWLFRDEPLGDPLLSAFRPETGFCAAQLPCSAARLAAQRRFVASMILRRPSGLSWRFLIAVFFVAPLRPEPLFCTGGMFCSTIRFAAQRLLIASAILLRPAVLMARFLVAGSPYRWDPVALRPDSSVPMTSRNAEMARSIADRCCSSSEMMLSMFFNEAPYQ